MSHGEDIRCAVTRSTLYNIMWYVLCFIILSGREIGQQRETYNIVVDGYYTQMARNKVIMIAPQLYYTVGMVAKIICILK
jgi:hypothetical protein